MAREIEFRGQRFDNGEWVYGYLYQLPLPSGVGCMILTTDNNHEDNSIEPEYHLAFSLWVDLFPVKPETVGQFTGQYDKNDKKIYEGDIVRWDKDQKLYMVEFRSGMFYASVEPCNPHIYGGFPLCFLCEEEQHCEIVGNRYDNPELLTTK